MEDADEVVVLQQGRPVCSKDSQPGISRDLQAAQAAKDFSFTLQRPVRVSEGRGIGDIVATSYRNKGTGSIADALAGRSPAPTGAGRFRTAAEVEKSMRLGDSGVAWGYVLAPS